MESAFMHLMVELGWVQADELWKRKLRHVTEHVLKLTTSFEYIIDSS